MIGNALRLVLVLGFLVKFLASAAHAGDLQFFPSRLYLSDTKRVTSISFRYQGDRPEKYQLSATFWRMTPEGRLEKVAKNEDVKPEERPLMKYIRFSPREFELKPGGEQTVQIMYAGPGALPEAEYRAQLLIEPSSEVAPKQPTKEKVKDNQLRFEIETKLSFAVPVIFRRGKPTFDVKLEKPAVSKGEGGRALASVEMVASGLAFPYGDFEVFRLDEGSDPQSLGFVRGIAGYRERRRVDVPLSIPADELKGKKVKIVFRSTEDAATQVETQAELVAAP